MNKTQEHEQDQGEMTEDELDLITRKLVFFRRTKLTIRVFTKFSDVVAEKTQVFQLFQKKLCPWPKKNA